MMVDKKRAGSAQRRPSSSRKGINKPQAGVDADASSSAELEPHHALLRSISGTILDEGNYRISKRFMVWVTSLIVLSVSLLAVSKPERFDELRQRTWDVLSVVDIELLRNFTETQVAAIRNYVSDFPVLFNSTNDIFHPHSDKNLRPKHPVILVPGFITTGLELWEGHECAQSYFRQRIWGTSTMIQHVLRNPKCWLKHMSLHSDGLDPPNIRLRPSSGLDSADYFIGRFWIWGPMIESLARIGYDSTTMFMASFDWRLHMHKLEVRDRYFSRLAHTIEGMVTMSGEKAVVITHSFGGSVWTFFMQWVEHHKSKRWVDRHISFIYNAGAPFLGVNKAITSILAGEMRDTQKLGIFLDIIMNSAERANLWRSWGSLHEMVLKGGNAIWPDLRFTLNGTNVTLDELIDFGKKTVPSFAEYMQTVDISSEPPIQPTDLICPVESNPFSCYRKEWGNVLASTLPESETLVIWCVYGTGISTDQASHLLDGEQIKLNSTHYDDESSAGIIYGEGDGSVTLHSLRYTCKDVWAPGTRQNPHKVAVKIREIRQDEGGEVNKLQRLMMDARNDKVQSSEHGDILGQHSVLEDVVALASGRIDLVNK